MHGTKGNFSVSQVELFRYEGDENCDPASEWNSWTASPESNSPHVEGCCSQREQTAFLSQFKEDYEIRLANEKQQAFELGRLQGRQDEQFAQEATLAAVAEKRRIQTADLIENFAKERDLYFQAVEREVVDLALGIAARILRREAQFDPLLLTGAVRVALGQLAENTETRIIVPELESDLWMQSLTLVPNLPIKPTVVSKKEMDAGDCRIESTLGSVDLGIRAQLREIEQGFFDSDEMRIGQRVSQARRTET